MLCVASSRMKQKIISHTVVRPDQRHGDTRDRQSNNIIYQSSNLRMIQPKTHSESFTTHYILSLHKDWESQGHIPTSSDAWWRRVCVQGSWGWGNKWKQYQSNPCELLTHLIYELSFPILIALKYIHYKLFIPGFFYSTPPKT